MSQVALGGVELSAIAEEQAAIEEEPRLPDPVAVAPQDAQRARDVGAEAPMRLVVDRVGASVDRHTVNLRSCTFALRRGGASATSISRRAAPTLPPRASRKASRRRSSADTVDVAAALADANSRSDGPDGGLTVSEHVLRPAEGVQGGDLRARVALALREIAGPARRAREHDAAAPARARRPRRPSRRRMLRHPAHWTSPATCIRLSRRPSYRVPEKQSPELRKEHR